MTTSTSPADITTREAPYWATPADELLVQLASTRSGLSAAEVEQRVAVLPHSLHAPAWWKLLLRQFSSPIVLILVGATIISGALGDLTDTVIILSIIVISGLLGFAQERGAGHAMRALLATVEPTSRVMRDGVLVDVPFERVVVGDIVELSPGDVPPGDCVVLTSDGLTVDESSLTGETFPVDKSPGLSSVGDPIGARSNTLFAGTHVVSGRGSLLVAAIGSATELSRIAEHLKAAAPRTGFERGMTRFGLLLTRIMGVLVVIIFVANLLLQRPVVDSALFSLALAVGLTPQLLPAIVGISLAQGARQMARRRVIVRRLDAIEDFGSMNILCCDKTGTLTQGAVRLDRAIGCDGSDNDEVAELAALNAGLHTGWANPIDAAISASHPLVQGAVLRDELPYDFSRRRLSVVVRRKGHRDLLITKGSFDAVVDASTSARVGNAREPLGAHLSHLHDLYTELSDQGYRVLAIATRTVASTDALSLRSEAGLELIGLLAFADPEKSDAAEIVTELAQGGISVRMVTGDNRHVAAHIAARVGIDASTVFTGEDIDARDDRALAAAVPTAHVFAEMDPVQKERVIRAFRASGAVVGYLGDGINDAPPLHAADVGISVESAVTVAKQSASIVLLEKDLRVLLDGVTQGRRTFANTMKYIFMTMSANFGNMLSMAIASIALPFLPLLAGQILLINLLTDLPATLLATDEVDGAQLKRPQRWNIRLIRNYMLVFGAVSSVFDLTTFAILRWGYAAGAIEFRSAWFVGSILTEVAVLFVLRTRGPFFRSKPSKWIVGASVLVAGIAIAIPYSPLAVPLGMTALPGPLLALIVLVTLGYVLVTEIVKRFFWRRPRA